MEATSSPKRWYPITTLHDFATHKTIRMYEYVAKLNCSSAEALCVRVCTHCMMEADGQLHATAALSRVKSIRKPDRRL